MLVMLIISDLGSGVTMMLLAVSGSDDFCHTIAYWPAMSDEEFHDHFAFRAFRPFSLLVYKLEP